ncbi:alpha/beta fold hydrolase [Engelhardtia mirabilis]|uniref:Haloalkane dehalogenase n=1 Tax=Engelhardtia mirabilis TaxID=2528011 RepID=A0A518BIB7_9BACT|nr:Haloalkane dehalogenase [Planctomycetes bacterium Pla133]QDV01047.1 Haloalkane dehalogenase [Planctomycetes bacterium Pla86]
MPSTDPTSEPAAQGRTVRPAGGKSRQRGAERAPLDLADDRRRLKNKLVPEYEVTPHFVRVDGGPWMHFVDEGNPAAPVLLCVHGNPSWSFHWRRLIDRFRFTHRVVAPDLIGCGFSEKPADFDYRLARHIDSLETLVDELGIERATLVVQDWGGAIGLGLAARRPELVERLVILNSGAFRSTRMPGRIAMGRVPFLGRLGIRGLGLFSRLALMWAVERKRWTRAERRGYLLPYASWADRVAIQAFVDDIPMDPSHRSWNDLVAIEESLSGLADRPTCIVWGARDWCFTTEFRDRYQQFFPAAEVHTIANAGHWVLEDAPEEVLNHIAAFLEAHPVEVAAAPGASGA